MISEVEIPVRTRGVAFSDEDVASAVKLLADGKAVKYGEYPILARDEEKKAVDADGTNLENRARNQGKALNALVEKATGTRYGISTWENGDMVIGALLPRPAKVITPKTNGKGK